MCEWLTDELPWAQSVPRPHPKIFCKLFLVDVTLRNSSALASFEGVGVKQISCCLVSVRVNWFVVPVERVKQRRNKKKLREI